MSYYAKAKVYCDGDHYIAIPHTTRPSKKRRSVTEPSVLVDENNNLVEEKEEISTLTLPSGVVLTEIKFEGDKMVPVKRKVGKGKRVSKTAMFEKLYEETRNKSRAERKAIILNNMKGMFKDEETAKVYVNINMRRKIRNLIYRRIRMCRKAYLNGMNYFCTFTYDDKLHTEESFEKGLKNCLQNFSKRKGWKYMGVWERGG